MRFLLVLKSCQSRLKGFLQDFSKFDSIISTGKTEIKEYAWRMSYKFLYTTPKARQNHRENLTATEPMLRHLRLGNNQPLPSPNIILSSEKALLLRALNAPLRITIGGLAVTIGRGSSGYAPLGVAIGCLTVTVCRGRTLPTALRVAVSRLAVTVGFHRTLLAAHGIAERRLAVTVSLRRSLPASERIAVSGFPVAVHLRRSLLAPHRIAICRLRLGNKNAPRADKSNNNYFDNLVHVALLSISTHLR